MRIRKNLDSFLFDLFLDKIYLLCYNRKEKINLEFNFYYIQKKEKK